MIIFETKFNLHYTLLGILPNTGINTITISNSRIAYSAGHGITYDDNSSMDISTITFENNNGNNYHRR